MRTRYVYFIQEVIGIHAPIKIGVSQDVGERLRNIQGCNPRKLEVYAVMGPMGKAKAFDLEDKLHHKFRRYRLRGEWFSGVIKTQFHRIQEGNSIEYS